MLNNIYEFDGEDTFWKINKIEPKEEMKISLFIGQRFKILSKPDKEIDIDEVLRIEKDERGSEYVSYKNDGSTVSGFCRSYSSFDRWLVKVVKQLDKKIKEKSL